ncbi:MAG: hypothetical protein ACYCZ2_17870 [Lutibacter sp.]|nr:MAG: hypothetical protein APF83_03060 [Lutibacter sp. BRH_c52]
MFDQLNDLVKQFGIDAVVNNAAVPNKQNEAVMNESSNFLLEGLKNMVAQGKINDLAGLFQGNASANGANPVVKQLTNELTNHLGKKFGLNNKASLSVASGLTPKVLGSLIGKAKDPNDSSFEISDLISAISGGNSEAGSGLMNAISNYGTAFGLDQNKDGKVDINDALAAVSKKSGGLGGLFGKVFGN